MTPRNRSAGRALITGATSGIGRELAIEFARHGHGLVLVARDQKRLQDVGDDLASTYHVPVTLIPSDLSRQESPIRISEELRRQSLNIDFLVNNAGFGTYGFFSETDFQSEWNMLNVNMVSLTLLSKLLLPGMIERRSGAILNVASTAAFQPGPLMAVYYATKAYVFSLSEAIANEVDGTGVTVTVLCPGPTRTGFQKRAVMEHSGLVKGREIMGASEVARAGYEGMMLGKRRVIPGLLNKVLAMTTRFIPRTMAASIVRRIQETKA